jgi:hypothetical protein
MGSHGAEPGGRWNKSSEAIGAAVKRMWRNPQQRAARAKAISEGQKKARQRRKELGL